MVGARGVEGPGPAFDAGFRLSFQRDLVPSVQRIKQLILEGQHGAVIIGGAGETTRLAVQERVPQRDIEEDALHFATRIPNPSPWLTTRASSACRPLISVM